jgi:hypothetical protein
MEIVEEVPMKAESISSQQAVSGDRGSGLGKITRGLDLAPIDILKAVGKIRRDVGDTAAMPMPSIPVSIVNDVCIYAPPTKIFSQFSAFWKTAISIGVKLY